MKHEPVLPPCKIEMDETNDEVTCLARLLLRLGLRGLGLTDGRRQQKATTATTQRQHRECQHPARHNGIQKEGQKDRESALLFVFVLLLGVDCVKSERSVKIVETKGWDRRRPSITSSAGE